MGSTHTWDAGLVLQEGCDDASMASGRSDVERRGAARQLGIVNP